MYIYIKLYIIYNHIVKNLQQNQHQRSTCSTCSTFIKMKPCTTLYNPVIISYYVYIYLIQALHLVHDQKRLDFYEFLVTKVISGQAAERPKGVARKAEAFGWVLTDSQEKL